ncbi:MULTISPECIES: hypothetical protein [Pseudomonas]|uniref:Uncharacterized protein n=2 Tax=Pseudomonas TaxID=286 RepID=A0A159ZVI4_PSEFL|nr:MULTISPECIES: hypothetical protein [Pseudomonas]AMZ71110.1 hypothetical protein TK06_08335 [Pseudomonas fluorescens]
MLQVSTFYQEMAKAIRLAATDSSCLKGEPEILFLEHESPHQVAQLLLELAMIEAMVEHLQGGSGGGTQVHLLPFEIVTVESL